MDILLKNYIRNMRTTRGYSILFPGYCQIPTVEVGGGLGPSSRLQGSKPRVRQRGASSRTADL